MELYRKYRPQTEDEMVGNASAIKAVKKELENGSHVFLFTGPAGTGKTTMARIIAKEVGAGDLSIKEINSAENRGIDTARDILEQMQYMPSDGDALVWIFDECHKWTNDMQNAMLKPLEDTPDHVYFFLCTTDPQKLIKPLVTRCSVVAMKPLSNEEMTYLLKRTARAEGKKLTPEVVNAIIEQADGGSRKALKLLAKVLYLDSEDEQLEVLSAGVDGENSETIELCRCLLSQGCNWAKLAHVIKDLDLSEPERIRQAVMGYMNAVLLKGKMNQNAVCALQAFGANPTFNNGKFQITIACLDYLSLLE